MEGGREEEGGGCAGALGFTTAVASSLPLLAASISRERERERTVSGRRRRRRGAIVVPSSLPPLLAEPSSLACAVASRARGRRAVRESRHVSAVAGSHAAAVLLAAAPPLEEEGSPVLPLTDRRYSAIAVKGVLPGERGPACVKKKGRGPRLRRFPSLPSASVTTDLLLRGA